MGKNQYKFNDARKAPTVSKNVSMSCFQGQNFRDALNINSLSRNYICVFYWIMTTYIIIVACRLEEENDDVTGVVAFLFIASVTKTLER